MDTAQAHPKRSVALAKKILLFFAYFCIFVILCDIVAYFGRKEQNKITHGTDKYTGVQLEAAKWAIEYERSLEPISILLDAHMPIHIEEVRPLRQDEYDKCIVSDRNHDPNDIRHYAVIVSNRTYFGVKESEHTWYYCASYKP